MVESCTIVEVTRSVEVTVRSSVIVSLEICVVMPDTVLKTVVAVTVANCVDVEVLHRFLGQP